MKSVVLCSSDGVYNIEVCMGMGTAGIRGCGYECCGNTVGMDLTIAGFPRGWIFTARCYASAVLAMALCPSVRHKSVFY